ncbi:asparagine synthase-related protein [Streptomyces sp. NPDC096079]|uniref:asparagine synthase-related protein n=1 Tax=Streptomyces sp. NPDC096079 TaxID=3155820 RepID=UPI00331C9943
MEEQWLAAGPTAESSGIGVAGLDGVRTGAGARVRGAAEGAAAVAVIGDCPVGEKELHGALAAVRAGRWEELTGWPGSYWVIAGNERERFVCGDLAGRRPIYYTVDGTWTTSLRRIGKPLTADLTLAAARIVAGSDHWPGRSPYEQISVVPGGCGLLLRTGQAPQLVDVAAIKPVEDLQSGAARFGSALTEAVQYRVSAAGATVGADLSGGLDSSAAVVLASQVGRVHAVTYTDGYTSAEDASFAARIAEHSDIEHTIAHGTDEDLPFSFPVGQPTGLEPAMGAALFDMDRTYLAPVAGRPLHLTGHGGDVVLDATSSIWVRLLQDGERRAAHRQVVAFARLRNMAPGPFWKSLRETAALGRTGVLGRAVEQLEKKPARPAQDAMGWSWCRLGAAASWLTPDARTQVAALLRQAAADTSQPERADEFDQWSALRFTGAAARAWEPYADALGVRPVYPYLDNTVVRAAFAVPPAARRGLYTFKPLLSAALPDLPDWLLGRRSKGSFTAQRVVAFQRHRARLGDLLTVSPLITAGLFDHAAVTGTLDQLGQGRTPIGAADMHQMLTASWWLTGTHTPAEASC